MWLPEIYQLRVGRNKSWFNSAWLGIATPFINIWRIIWNVWIETALNALLYTIHYRKTGRYREIFAKAWVTPFLGAMRITLTVLFIFPLMGLAGNVVSCDATIDETIHGRK